MTHQQSATATLSSIGSVLAGGNEMGELMRQYDWSASPVGPVEQWPQSLRTALSILLDSRYPMYIAWGREFVQFYNDAYRPILGVTKHPAALGRSTRTTFAEIWPFIGPMFEEVMRSGQATFLEDQLLPLDRYGYLEECYFTFCYSAIRIETGEFGGVFVTCSENTSRVLGERRLRTLRDLAAAAAPTEQADAAMVRAAAVLGQNPADIPFSLIYLVDGEQAHLVASTGVDGTSAAFPAAFRLSEAASAWPFGTVTNELTVVPDIEQRCGTIQAHPWPEAVRDAVVLPIGRSGVDSGLDALLVIGLNPRRAFDDDYRGFAKLAARQIGATVAAALAYEAERLRAQALAELDRAKTTFFSNVSHEFRTPLTLMLGPIEDLLRRPAQALAPEDRQKLELLERNGLRLLKLVNTLLDFARLEAGRVEAAFEPVDLCTLTMDLASTFRSAIERAGMQLEVACSDLGQSVFVDVAMWEKIVLNLLSNAFKFTFDGSIRVTVGRSDDGERARLTVSDTGVGITADELPHIFERFRRIEGTRSRTLEGSGIGLALVQELVRLHGGTISASSTPGRGTTFTIEIPLGDHHLPSDHVRPPSKRSSTALGAAPFIEEALRWLPDHSERGAMAPARNDPSVAGQAPLSGPVDRPTDRARVLVVDDNADMRLYLANLLSPHYQVDLAVDGITALEQVHRSRPALIVTDLMMPGLDGFGLIEKLRGDLTTAAIPIIALSARAGEESTLEGLARGADDYLVKPFSARELLARVRAHLGFSQAIRKERERLITLFEQSPSFIAVLTGPQHVFETANAAYLSLVGRRNIVGKPVLEALPELAGQGFKELLDGVYTTGVPYVGREAKVMLTRTAAESPEERFVDFLYHPVVEPDGHISGVFVHGVDITAQVRARMEMERLYHTVREANEAKRQFLTAMSHELRTPLNAVIGYSDLLTLGVRGTLSTDQRGDVERIRSASSYLLTLINDILNFSKSEAGQVDLHPEPLPVTRVLANAGELMQTHVARRSIRLEVEPVDSALAIFADPERVQQILLNLLINAVKFTEPGGSVRVWADVDEDFVQLHVDDTGCGIAPEQLERIFEPFVQLDRTANPDSQKGLGLGLAISRELARRMDGDVTATSTVGVGSRFTVRLPRLGSNPGA